MAESLQGRRVLLVGGSGGIGSAIAEALLWEGVAELIAAPAAPSLAAGAVTAESVDVTDVESVRALALRLGEQPLHAVINCAGVNGNSALFTGDWAQRSRLEMEVNYFGLLHLGSVFGPMLAAHGGGHFMTLLSFLSHVNLPAMATYCASKAAAHSALQAMRAEWAAAGVHVCGIYPTAVDTTMSRDVAGPKQSPQALAQEVVRALKDGSDALYPGEAAGAFAQYLADPLGLQRAMAKAA